MMTKLFQQALHIKSPWLIKSIDFDVDKKRLDIHIDSTRGSTFGNPDADDGTGKMYKAYDTVQKTWQHLNFLNMNAIYMHGFLELNVMIEKSV